MRLLDKLKVDRDMARKAHNAIVGNLLGTVIAECQNQATRGKVAHALTDAEVLGIVQKTAKQIDETAAMIMGNPSRAAEYTKLEIEKLTLAEYLPAPLTEAEIRTIIIDLHEHATPLGKIMAHFKEAHVGRYDSAQVASIAKETIAKS